jgi:hypothetical protein
VIAFEHQHLSRFSHRFAMYLDTGSGLGWERQEVAFLQTLRDRNPHIGNRACIERAVFFYSKSCSGPSLFSLFESELDQAANGLRSSRLIRFFLSPVIYLVNYFGRPARADLNAGADRSESETGNGLPHMQDG